VILLTGTALVGTSIVCLYLSDTVARTGSWWQGTLDAFGVGFVVGGIVDVTAIALLNQILAGSGGPAWKQQNSRAEDLLDMYSQTVSPNQCRLAATEVGGFIEDYGDAIDPLLRARLRDLLKRLNDTSYWGER
jgi:hypothetical protein